MSSETENITPQDIRDIFNRQGMNYSQIVGEDSTVVSCSLHCFNEAIEQLLPLIQEATTKAKIEELESLVDEDHYVRTNDNPLTVVRDRIKELKEDKE